MKLNAQCYVYFTEALAARPPSPADLVDASPDCLSPCS